MFKRTALFLRDGFPKRLQPPLAPLRAMPIWKQHISKRGFPYIVIKENRVSVQMPSTVKTRQNLKLNH